MTEIPDSIFYALSNKDVTQKLVNIIPVEVIMDFFESFTYEKMSLMNAFNNQKNVSNGNSLSSLHPEIPDGVTNILSDKT